MGDLNNDKLNDLVTVNDAQTQFRVHYFSSGTMQFQTTPAMTVTNCPYINAISIGTDATAQDLHLENLIFVCEDPLNNATTTLRVMKQQPAGNGLPTFVDSSDPINNLQIFPGSQPFFVDINGDLR